MPYSNKSQSASSSSLPPSQGPERNLLSRSSSKPKPESSSYSASIRRFSSRRPRPTVATIADVLVSSLVFASYCREHSPRGRSLSTMCMGASTNNMARWHGRSVTGDRQLSSSRRRIEYLGPPVGCLEARCWRPQRMFSSDAAQGAKDEVHDEETSKGRPREEKHLTTEPSAETEVGRRRDLDDIPSRQLSNQPGHDSITDNSITSSNAKSGHSPTDTPDNTASLHTKSDLSTGSDPSRPRGRMNSAAEKYTSTSEFYHATIGKKMDWKEAVDTVTDRKSVV